MITVTLYSRSDCHLCQQAEEDLKALQEQAPHRLVVIDVDSDPVLQKAFGFEVPVVEVGPYRLRAPFSRQDLNMTLGAAADRQAQLERIGDKKYQAAVKRGMAITPADRFSYWLSKHYLAMFNFLLFLYVGLPFLAPVLMKAGASAAANVIYKVYSPLCHQFGFRSWYLFGEQAYYPHSAALVPGLVTFEGATGITDSNDPSRLAARAFTGDETLGYKVALCQRDVAIYASLLLFGLLYAAARRRIPQLHWLAWILIGLAPIALDGVSQLISQLPFSAIQSILPYRESTPLLRSLTGFLFGFTTAWFGFPSVEEMMADTRRLMAKKFAVTGSIG